MEDAIIPHSIAAISLSLTELLTSHQNSLSLTALPKSAFHLHHLCTIIHTLDLGAGHPRRVCTHR
jgi:hypothetical protein